MGTKIVPNYTNLFVHEQVGKSSQQHHFRLNRWMMTPKCFYIQPQSTGHSSLFMPRSGQRVQQRPCYEQSCSLSEARMAREAPRSLWKEKQLTLEGNCLLQVYWVVIPKSLQERVLTELHQKALAWNYIWWPGIDHAQWHKNAPAKAPLHHCIHGPGLQLHGSEFMWISQVQWRGRSSR